MLTTSPLDLSPELPWQRLSSPLEQWEVLPTFLIGEYLFIGLALLALAHARRQGRDHLMVWVAAILAGTANDLIFMALPVVDNFWQSQATIMLTPRLPLYIPCVYVCFMYLPTISVWRMGLTPWPRAAASGLAAIAFYAPYDIVGAKFLWWTWHDTDLPIASRLLGVPIGSTIWVITFVFTFAWLLGWVTDRDRAVSGRSFALGVGLVCALCTALMVVQMTVLQQLDGGVPGPRALVAVLALYGGLAIAGLRRARPEPGRRADRPLWMAVGVYFATLTLLMAAFSPETHRSESLHQTYGPCGVEARDLMGNVRHQFLCAEGFDEDFSFACVDRLPESGTSWYTVCGRPHTSYGVWLGAVALLGLIGSGLYAYLLGAGRGPSVGAR